MAQGRSHHGGMGGSVEAALRPDPSHAAHHNARSPPERRGSMLARSGRPAASRAIQPSCRNQATRAAAALSGSSRLSDLLEGAADSREAIQLELGKGSLDGRRTQIHDAIESSRPESLAIAPEDLAQPTAQTVACDGAPDASWHGDPESGSSPFLPRQEKQLEMASRHADPGGVALFEFPSLPKAVAAGEGLRRDRAWIHTESLLRPLRRRADRTARPERVRIRTRKPCVRLRRRLLG
jgi:hypothetical protein